MSRNLDRRSPIHVRPAAAADLPAIRALLEAADLPLAGVASDAVGFFVAGEARAVAGEARAVGGAAGTVVGAAGLERYGAYGLLRSVVVDPSARGRGVGAALTAAVVAAARAAGLEALYALTTTAEGYFPRFGFVVVERAAVPAPVRGAVEFRELCPSTAAVLELTLV